jgi:hypothetical protein
VLNLDIQNRCLLSRWLYNLINTDGAWQQLLRNKYLGGKSILQVCRKPGDSQFWSVLMSIKDQLLSWAHSSYKMRNRLDFGKTNG